LVDDYSQFAQWLLPGGAQSEPANDLEAATLLLKSAMRVHDIKVQAASAHVAVMLVVNGRAGGFELRTGTVLHAGDGIAVRVSRVGADTPVLVTLLLADK
jgi:hypothetical protein